jgi:polysaccharide export outer membrane protein
MFLAQQMKIFHRDLVYVSNATLSDVQKFMQLFNLIVSPAAQGASIASTVSGVAH